MKILLVEDDVPFGVDSSNPSAALILMYPLSSAKEIRV